MSEYTRNNAMIACIILVVITGAALVGFLAWNGGLHVNISGEDWKSTTTFGWTNSDPSPPATMTIDFDLDVGDVNVTFVEDPTLIAKVTMLVPNKTLAERGEPTVTFTDQAVTLRYPAAKIVLVLGNATKYALDFQISVGTVIARFNESATVQSSTINVNTGEIEARLNGSTVAGDLGLTVGTGKVLLSMNGDVNIQGNRTFTTSVGTGQVNLLVVQPTDVGMIFTGSVSTGDVETITDTWNVVSENVYKTTDYGATTNSVTLNASVGTGAISAFLL